MRPLHAPLPVLHYPAFVHMIAPYDLVLLFLCIDADKCLHLHAVGGGEGGA